jgi:hypothetical protein
MTEFSRKPTVEFEAPRIQEPAINVLSLKGAVIVGVSLVSFVMWLSSLEVIPSPAAAPVQVNRVESKRDTERLEQRIAEQPDKAAALEKACYDGTAPEYLDCAEFLGAKTRVDTRRWYRAKILKVESLINAL